MLIINHNKFLEKYNLIFVENVKNCTMNKKLGLLFILLFCVISWKGLQSQDKLFVVTTTSIFEDMVKNVGADKVLTSSIVPVGSDPHSYEPRPSDVRMVASADIIFVNGLNLEGWILELIRNSGTKAPVITLTQGINALRSSLYENAFDPHAWMDASFGVIYIKNIVEALQNADPEHASIYEKELERYVQVIEETDSYIFERIASIPSEQRLLITSHDAFAYYGKRYGLELSALMGISTEAEPQTSDMVRVARQIKQRKIPAVFIESTINPKLLEQIAKDHQINIGGELYSDSLGPEGSGADSYTGMLKYNTDVITMALSKGIISGTKFNTSSSSNKWMIYTAILIFMGLVFIYMFKNTLQ